MTTFQMLMDGEEFYYQNQRYVRVPESRITIDSWKTIYNCVFVTENPDDEYEPPKFQTAFMLDHFNVRPIRSKQQ